MLPSESILISIVYDRLPCVRNPTFCLENLADDVQKTKKVRIHNAILKPNPKLVLQSQYTNND